MGPGDARRGRGRGSSGGSGPRGPEIDPVAPFPPPDTDRNRRQDEGGRTSRERSRSLTWHSRPQRARASDGTSPSCFRLKAEMLLALPKARPREAEQCLRTAIAIAQQQEAKFWELRVATCLARLWARQAQRADARDLLAPVYGLFNEGLEAG